VSIATGIHKKKLSHTTTLSTCSSMGQKLITIDTFLNNEFNEKLDQSIEMLMELIG
jgi:hypothetical protein